MGEKRNRRERGLVGHSKVKVKVPLDNFCPVVFDSRGRCSSPFPSHRASVLSEDNLPLSHGQCDLDTERCYLPTEVVPIYLLAFACFRTARLAGAGTSDGHSLRRMDSILRLFGLLTLQHRLLQFSPQRHHVPTTGKTHQLFTYPNY